MKARRLVALTLAAVAAGCDADGGREGAPAPGAAEPGRVAELEELLLQEKALRAEELGSLLAEAADLREEVGALRGELQTERDRRRARELEWYRYNQGLAALSIDDLVDPFGLDAKYSPATVEAEPPEEGPAEELRQQRDTRAGEAALSLGALFRMEEIRGMELFEHGELRGGALGPVVFRLLDDRGSLAGSLYAERLRLEASRAGYTITLVLEDGFESRGGVRTPFRGGVRRIVLPHVDPEPWIDAMPELFPTATLAPSIDDGTWNKERLRTDLNALLRRSSSGAYWRVGRLGGVVGDDLLGVQLEGFDASGRLERRVFADRMRLEREGAAIFLTLYDGVTERGRERVPFLDGRHRIYLPEAHLDEWQAANLPGFGGAADGR